MNINRALPPAFLIVCQARIPHLAVPQLGERRWAGGHDAPHVAIGTFYLVGETASSPVAPNNLRAENPLRPRSARAAEPFRGWWRASLTLR